MLILLQMPVLDIQMEQFSNVPLYAITGNGTGATATVTISNNVVNTINSISNAGNGYAIGDVVGLTTANMVQGGGAQITVNTTTGTDTLYLQMFRVKNLLKW